MLFLLQMPENMFPKR